MGFQSRALGLRRSGVRGARFVECVRSARGGGSMCFVSYAVGAAASRSTLRATESEGRWLVALNKGAR
jgi:hypothetical protein